ncbi:MULTISPECIES: hypothetical protein [Acinetobacter]|jgi:hypothetical protein|nr:hypothetical protein [Acinetobacter baumannii]MCY0274102.1 hypothetical protein [Acinetobacter baumannii]
MSKKKEPAMSEFKAGDWVKTQGHIGLMVIYKVTGEKAIVDVISRTGKSIGLSGYKLSEIERASEAEIKAGHRIESSNDQAISDCSVSNLCQNDTQNSLPIKQENQDMGDDSHIENRISPLCKSKDF